MCTRPDRPTTYRQIRSQVVTALTTLDVRIPHGHRAITWLHEHGARRLFAPGAVVGQIIVAVAGLVAVVHVFQVASLRLQLSAIQAPVALALGLFAVGVHECAHALVVVHHGRRLDAVGLRLHLGVPAFYVESVSAMQLRRRHRIAHALAGSWAEWMVTSVVALWVSAFPTTVGLVVLARFVILNSLTILSNLIPFARLDGALVFADLVGEPDLPDDARSAGRDLIMGMLAGRRVTRRQLLLTAYATANGVVSGGLLATAVVFWYSLFGEAIATLADVGPAGWLVLALLAILLLRPAALVALDSASATAATVCEVTARLRFRLEWRWRVPAVHAFARVVPELDGADDRTLGILAGQVRRVRSASDARHCHLTRGGRHDVHDGVRCPTPRRGIVVEFSRPSFA